MPTLRETVKKILERDLAENYDKVVGCDGLGGEDYVLLTFEAKANAIREGRVKGVPGTETRRILLNFAKVIKPRLEARRKENPDLPTLRLNDKGVGEFVRHLTATPGAMDWDSSLGDWDVPLSDWPTPPDGWGDGATNRTAKTAVKGRTPNKGKRKNTKEII